MSKWQNIRLGDIADFSNGINFDKSSYCEYGTYLIGVSDFGEELFPNYSTLRHIDSTIARECNLLKDGDIVFVRSNGNKALVGRSMLIKNPPKNTSFSGFCIRARIKDHESFDPLFFAYLFKSEKFRKAIAGCSIGANIQNLSQGKLSSYIAYVPPIEVQRKIADILSAYDDLIENNRKQIKLLEEAAQRLYKEWFIDLRFPGHETTPIIDGIPAGWEKKQLGSVIKLRSGFAFKSKDFVSDGIFRIVTIKNVQDSIFNYENTDTITEIPHNMPKHCILSDGDILLSLTGNIGRVCMVTEKNCLLNQRVAKLETQYPGFAYCLFRNKDFCYSINSLANGAAQQNLSPIKTEEMKILVPDTQYLHLFEKQSDAIIDKILVLYKNIIITKHSRNYLLPKLVTGELEVK